MFMIMIKDAMPMLTKYAPHPNSKSLRAAQSDALQPRCPLRASWQAPGNVIFTVT